MAVPDRFSEGHDVRHDALRLVRPPVRPHAAEPHLHLVGHAHGAGFPHVSVGGLEVSVGEDDLPGAPGDRLGVEGCDRATAQNRAAYLTGDRGGVLAGRVGIAGTIGTTVRVGHRGHAHVLRLPRPTFVVELVRAQVHHRAGVSVVRAVEHHDVTPSRSGPGQSERQLVRLTPRTHEEAHLQRIGHRAREALGILDDVVVQVPGVRVQGSHLAPRGLDDPRVTVSDVAHVVHAIEVGPASIVEQKLTLSAHDLERSPVRQAQ
jgi:hypothetical protein